MKCHVDIIEDLLLHDTHVRDKLTRSYLLRWFDWNSLENNDDGYQFIINRCFDIC